MKAKFLFIFLSVVVLGLGCKNSSKAKKEVSSDLINNPATASGDTNSDGLPLIKFEEENHDFGLILQGEKVSYTFKFKNIGKSDLIVDDVSTSCGCTVPKFSREPIAPGENGEVEVIFDSNNRQGRQFKTITVWTNSQPNKTKLQIESEIVVPK